jgi:N-sulfoglucosamine sulfohydrolase
VNLSHGLEYPHASDLWGSPTWQGVLKRRDAVMGQRPVKAFLQRPKEELYDLANDPNELKNLLAGSPSAEVKKLHGDMTARLQDWRKKTNDPWLIKDTHE